MKKFLLVMLCVIAYTQTHVWVHNKSKYYIKFVANSGEVLKLSPGYADFVGDFKYTFPTYSEFTIDVIDPQGAERQVFKKRVGEGGNRKIVVKDNGSPDTIYIAEDILETRLPSSWGHKTKAEDTGTHWL